MSTEIHPEGAEPAPAGNGSKTRRGWALLGQIAVGAVVIWAALSGLGRLLVAYWVPSRFGRADSVVVEFLADHRIPAGNTISLGAVLLADTLTVAVVAAVSVVGLLVILRRWEEPLFLATVVIGEVLIFTATTAVVERERPPVVHLDAAPPTSDFPSGHTAAAICLYGALAVLAGVLIKRRVYRRAAWVIAIAIPVLVAAGRLYRGMHFPTDVLASALLGGLWLAWMTRIYPLGKGVARAATTRA
ncbi:MAG: phosphatase PAP2 family protein [Mycobacteriales bacterium]